MAKCDLCGAAIDIAKATVLTPSEMRVIAGNGYGEMITTWPTLSIEGRRSRLQSMALVNDTAWALCPQCHRDTRSYAHDQTKGMSKEDWDVVHDIGIAPLLAAQQRLERESGASPARTDASGTSKGLSHALKEAVKEDARQLRRQPRLKMVGLLIFILAVFGGFLDHYVVGQILPVYVYIGGFLLGSLIFGSADDGR